MKFRGSGKTALAIRWAHDQADRFPDGALFADLHGYSPDGLAARPEEVLGQFLRSLGVPGNAIPDGLVDRTGLFRSLLDGRRVLVLLDNAATSEQVRPLLPGSADCLVVVTSRNRLSGLAVREGATRITLHPLRSSEAGSLLRTIIGNDRFDAEPDAASLLAARCACLPLALRIAAERAASRPNSTLAELAGELADERGRLNVLAVGGDEPSALRTVFSWSYRALHPEDARMFRYLSTHPGRDVTPPAAAALLGVHALEAAQTLDQLASSHLLDEQVPSRYRLPPLLRAYAAERFSIEEPPSARPDAAIRYLTWYLHTSANAAQAISPHQRHLMLLPADVLEPLRFRDHRDALTWCDAELDNLVSAVHAAAADQLDQFAWQLPASLKPFFDLRKAWKPWIATHHLGLSATRRLGDRVAEAWLLTSLAAAYRDLGRLDEARDLLEESLAIQRETGDQHGEAHSLIHLGRTLAAQRRLDKALAQLLVALQILPNLGDAHGEARALLEVAAVYRGAGQHLLAREPVEAALAIFRHLRDRRGEGSALDSLAAIYHGQGYLDEAVAEFDRALDAWRDVGDRYREAVTLDCRGHVLHELGQATAAESSWRRSSALLNEVDDPRAVELSARLRIQNGGSTHPNDKAC